MSKVVIDEKKLKWTFDRRVVNFIPVEEKVLERFKKGEQFRIYYGIDPTGPDIHLGHTIQLLFLKDLYELGHKPILLIGDFTAQIGDPSGKDTTRRPLSKEEIKENMKTYLNQVYRILPKGSFEVKYNSEWLGKLELADFLKLASNVTVQQTLAREMFQRRISENKPIGLHEFLYPLMQGYDSVAMKVDGEIGGGDQLFNMLVGRTLEKKYLNKDKIVLGTKLLVDPTGKKISKSEGNFIAINDSPNDIFGKVMSIPDGEAIRTVFELATNIGSDKYHQYNSYQEFAEGDLVREEEKDPKAFKQKVAFELVKMYHGENEAEKARNEWDKVFSKGELPSEIEEIENRGSVMQSSVMSGIVSSNSEFKRLVEQGAVRVNNKTIKEWEGTVNSGDVVQIGPKKFVKIK